MKTLKQWLNQLLGHKVTLDVIDESSDESFPASDPPAWAGSEHKSTLTAGKTNHPNAISVLKEEHRAIMKVMYLIHQQVEILEQNKPLNKDVLKNIAEFMRQFIENIHYPKEANYLYPALEHSGAPLDECPFSTLKQDHDASLSHIATLEKLVPLCEKNDAAIREKLLEALDELKEIYTRHTLQEENFIFPLAEKYLSPGVQKTMLSEFDKIDHPH